MQRVRDATVRHDVALGKQQQGSTVYCRSASPADSPYQRLSDLDLLHAELPGPCSSLTVGLALCSLIDLVMVVR